MDIKNLYLNLLMLTLTDQVAGRVEARSDGRDWPKGGFTMIGEKRLENIRGCIDIILDEKIEGDLLEAGVWKGGASIYMKGCLSANGNHSKKIFLADSFRGLPAPKDEYPADQGDTHYQYEDLAISLEDVRKNFHKFELLDEDIKFIEGWFHETLFQAPIDKLALLRLDGDMYESTWVTLEALYQKVVPGGFIIVDDYGYIESCKKAVHDFLKKNSLNPTIEKIDWTGVFWRKE
jgi:O-methyltransferase